MLLRYYKQFITQKVHPTHYFFLGKQKNKNFDLFTTIYYTKSRHYIICFCNFTAIINMA